jgi:hypothetical protein
MVCKTVYPGSIPGVASKSLNGQVKRCGAKAVRPEMASFSTAVCKQAPRLKLAKTNSGSYLLK